MFERYTEDARMVVVASQEDARALRHNYIGTEHLLLGLLRQPPDSVVGQVLARFGMNWDGTRARLLTLVPEGEEASQGQLPFTPRARRALETSLHEARSRVGPEHLLLTLAGGDEDSVAVRLLRGHDVVLDELRAAVMGALPAIAAVTSGEHTRRATISARRITVDLSDEANRVLMSAGARALDDGRTLITSADIAAALSRRRDADDPPPQAATG